jgi:RNA polymerase sigma factor (sigma-70 family)
MPDLYVRHERSEIAEAELYHLIERRLVAIVIGAMHDLGLRNIALIEDLVQELPLRLATMKAVERFDPSRSSPTTYLYGIARTLIREQLWRRQRPEAIAGDAIDRMSRGGSELDRVVREEQYQELYCWLDQLSDGELRAIIKTFGPTNGYCPPIGPRRRLRNPDAIPRALDILRQLGAHHFEQ